MKKLKKIISLTLSILMLISVLAVAPITSNAAQTDVQAVGTTYSGTTGDCSWSLDTSTGELTISGNGAMGSYLSSSTAPWYSYRSYIKTATISYGVTTVGQWSFYNCTSLTSVTIPSSVLSIGNYSFYYCTSLTSITIPSSITSIGSDVFNYCTSLTSVTIPSSVTSIGGYAFNYCTSLTSITIPSSVVSIGSDAFRCCTSLTSITIPSSITSIGYEAFYKCKSLEDVYYAGTESEWDNIYINSYNDPLTNATIHYSVSTNGEATTNIILGETTTSLIIGDEITYVCKLKSDSTIGCGQFTLNYPENLLEIKSVAFPLTSDAKYNYTENLTDELKFNFSNVITGYDFSVSAVLIEVVFNVKAAGEGKISLDKEVLSNMNDANVLNEAVFTETITASERDNNTTIAPATTIAPTTEVITDPIESTQETVVTEPAEVTQETFIIESTESTTVTYITEAITDATEEATATETTEPATDGTVAPTLPADGTFHVVAGVPELCNGVSWDPADASNLMTETSDGVFEITYTNVPAGIYQFKVTTGGAWDNADYNLTGNAMFGLSNAEITVPTDDSTVKITFADVDGFAKAFVNGIRVGVTTGYPTITAGVSQTANITVSGTIELFEFTPETSGVYKIYSAGNYDTYGYLYDSSMNELTSNDDGTEDNNFAIEYTLTKNTTYIIGVKFYSSDKIGSFSVNVEKLPTSLKLSNKSAIIYKGEICNINVIAENQVGSISYKSLDTSVATVTSSGFVKGIKAGATVITVSNNGVETQFIVTVKDKLTQKITATKSYKKTYGSKAFNLNAKTKGNSKLSYSSSNKKIVKVSSKGKVTIKGCGKATITIKASETEKYNSATKKITVNVSAKKVSSKSFKLKRLDNFNSKVKLSWGKVKNITEYQYFTYRSTAKGLNTNNIKTTKNNYCKISLGRTPTASDKGKKIFIKVRTVVKINGKRYYSDWVKKSLTLV